MPFRLKTLAAKTVTTAGTQVPLSATTLKARMIVVQADPSNAGNVFLGDSSVDSTNGIVLEPGESYSYAVTETIPYLELDLNAIYVDAATNADKVRIQYLEQY